ncbi:MAG: cation diffusion facilitator family transporter [Vicinamibacterales bacterium]
MSDRYGSVLRALNGVLVLNLLVAGAKIWLGFATGAVSILSDGFHSLTDSGSNIVALIGVSVARRPPDENHPYGHRKYETMASLGILLFLLLVLVQVVRSAMERLQFGGSPDVDATGFAILMATLAVNVFVVWYEEREGRRLKSEVLLADAKHTRSDVLTSCSVLAALVGVRLGYPIFDPLAALFVAAFILHACWKIAQDVSPILSDETVFAEDDVRAVVQSVQGVLGCEKIRTRGAMDHVFMDLHVWFDGALPLSNAHDLSHVVKDRLMVRFPELADVVIHIEPPPIVGGRPRRRHSEVRS